MTIDLRTPFAAYVVFGHRRFNVRKSLFYSASVLTENDQKTFADGSAFRVILDTHVSRHPQSCTAYGLFYKDLIEKPTRVEYGGTWEWNGPKIIELASRVIYVVKAFHGHVTNGFNNNRTVQIHLETSLPIGYYCFRTQLDHLLCL